MSMSRTLFGLMAVSALSLLGCQSGSSGSGEVALGVSVAPISVATGADLSGASSGLVISRVRLLVAHAKVGYINEEATGPSADIGPVVIDLTADELQNGAQRTLSLGTLPAGTYGGAEIEIQPLDAGADTSAEELADFAQTGASVLVDGTYNGAAFQFAGHFLAEQGTDGDVEITADTPVTLALTVDLSTWFLDADGVAVDPTDASQHDALAVAICETLDTQEQMSMGPPAGDAPDGSAPPASSSTSSAPAGGPPHGGKGHHGGGGGGKEHCVEQSG